MFEWVMDALLYPHHNKKKYNKKKKECLFFDEEFHSDWKQAAL